VEIAVEQRTLGRDVEGNDVIHPFEPGEHRKSRKKSILNIGSCQTGLPSAGKKRLEASEGGKGGLADGQLL